MNGQRLLHPSTPFLYSWEVKPGHWPRLATTIASSICWETQEMHLWKEDFPPPSSPLPHWISDSVPFQMLFPVLLAIQGTVGAVYCVVISSLGLLSGPFCDTGSGNYTYPFRNGSLEWVAFMVLGQCLTSNDDTADDHRECVLSVWTIQ